MKITYLFMIVVALGTSSSSFAAKGDYHKLMNTHKTVGSCNPDGPNWAAQRPDIISCSADLSGCDDLKPHKMLKCRKDRKDQCVEDTCSE